MTLFRFNRGAPNLGASLAMATAVSFCFGDPAQASINDLYVVGGNNTAYVVRTNHQGVPQGVVTTVPLGNCPQAARVTPDRTQVWVVNGCDATVTAINTSTYATQTFSVGTAGTNFPTFLAFSPVSNVAYVTDGNTNQVLFFDTLTHALTGTVAVGNTPGYAAVTPNGARLYVTNFFDNSVSVVNTYAKSILTTIVLPNTNPPGTSNPPNDSVDGCSATSVESVSPASPQGVAASPDGNYIYVVNSYSANLLPCKDGGNGDIPFQQSTVNVISTWSNTIVGTVLTGGDSADFPAFSPDGSKLYVTNTGNDDYALTTIGVLNSSSRSGGPRAVITLPNGWSGPAEVDTDPDPRDNLVYVATDQNGVAAVSTLSNAVVAQVPIVDATNGAFPTSIAVVRRW
jgi:YVTN family beta-propeller protein